MKKILLTLFAFVALCFTMNAQILRTEELEKYAKEKYGDKWADAAANIGEKLPLDKNQGITFVQVIEAPGKTRDQLYVLLNYWFTTTFNDANAVIKLNDREIGTIIAEGYMANIAGHAGGTNSYNVSIRPVIKCDLKDGKVRVTYTVPFYSVTKFAGGGILGAIAAGMSGTATNVTRVEQNWTLDKCYPYAEKDRHKKTSSKALVMAYAYSNVIMDKIEECIKNGLTGNEGDEW